MAWRDSRRDRRRLFLFSLSIVFGIAGLVSIGSLRVNLQGAIEEQAKELLGADLMLSSRRLYSEDVEKRLQSIPGERVDETSFMTMLRFVDSEDATRLVQIRAIEFGYPFYGTVETEPADAWQNLKEGNGIVLERSLMDQFGAQPGEKVRIGELETTILGYLVKAPPRPSAFSAFAPLGYLAPEQLEATQLLGNRSMARYRSYFKIDSEVNVDEEILTKDLTEFFTETGIQYESVEKRKRNLGRVLDNLYSFLSLIGFIALVLGGIGIASAIHVHVQGRIKTVAVLRCIGSTADQAFAIYLAQGMMLGLIGSLLGTVLGIGIQKAIPGLVSIFLPFSFEPELSWQAIAGSVAIGLLICLSFSLLPLLKIRRISALSALRSDVAPQAAPVRDKLWWAVLGGLTLSLVFAGLTMSPEERPFLGLYFVLALGVVLGLLALFARGISKAAVHLRTRFSYTVRQGIANLHRPRNQTLSFMVSIGLGVFLIVTMLSTQRMLTQQFEVSPNDRESNLFVIDVQPDQREGVEALMRSNSMELIEIAPMIPMRLTEIKGKAISEIQKDEATAVPGWIVRRDFRSTYRETLSDSETLLKGTWIPRVEAVDFEKPIPVSIDDGMATDLKVELGDQLGMDVQGLPLTLEITSIREVDWERMGLNFFLVFPSGVLEEAPGFQILTTYAETSQQSGAFQRDASIQFPNLTVFDMSLILQTIESIVARIGNVIQFMTLFTIAAGAVILVGTILTGQRDRVEESVLLRTLGASKSQIQRILLSEYLALGLFGALTGSLLGVIATWVLAVFVFGVPFLSILASIFLVILITILTVTGFGMFLSRNVTAHPPLAVLRGEQH